MNFHRLCWTARVMLGWLLLPCAMVSAATTVAYDDASDPVYIPGGPYNSLNGGFGLGPWITNGFPFGGNPNLQEYVGTSTLNGPGGPDIDTGGVAWGNNVVPGGNTFQARRSLTTDLTIGGTYSISLDTGDVDGQETISFGRGNNVMCQFYYNASFANYQFTDTLSAITSDTGILQTFGGLRLTLTRIGASTYSFQAKRLSDNLTWTLPSSAYDTSAIPGIRTITVNNLDGGQGPGHAMFVNAMEATAIPEPASYAMIALAPFVLRRARRD